MRIILRVIIICSLLLAIISSLIIIEDNTSLTRENLELKSQIKNLNYETKGLRDIIELQEEEKLKRLEKIHITYENTGESLIVRLEDGERFVQSILPKEKLQSEEPSIILDSWYLAGNIVSED